MTRLTLRSLASRKLRTALTAMAVVLGVAMISGTYVLTDTIDRAFGDIFQQAAEGVDVSVTPRQAVDEFGQTVVMVTHDREAAAIADRIVELADGRVLTDRSLRVAA